MDMYEASRILNMELLGLQPCDFDLSDDDFAIHPEDVDDWPDDRDAPGGDRTITITFDTQTDLEYDLIGMALAYFMHNRTTATTVRVDLDSISTTTAQGGHQ